MSSPLSHSYAADPVLIQPGSFRKDKHFYSSVKDATLHPTVDDFLHMNNETIAKRFCQLHPDVDPVAVRASLGYSPSFLRWAGCDLMLTVNEHCERRWVLIETNTCPSGQKSMPTRPGDDLAGYRVLLEKAFIPLLKQEGLPEGALAVLYDKNLMETSGYAAALAELAQEPVYLVHVPEDITDSHARFVDGVLEVHDLRARRWVPVRAAVRYVTQRPWTRIPPVTRTIIFNPVLACLAGGRNKMLAAKAYARFNDEQEQRTHLGIRVPDTVWDLTLDEVPACVERFGGVAVVKAPYSNAGQGVYTLTSAAELDAFMKLGQRVHHCQRFVVQALIGGRGWSSRTTHGTLQHVGTVPDEQGRIFVSDLRMMVGANADGYFPVAMYARRAHLPLPEDAPGACGSWAVLGTNLSVRNGDGSFSTEEDRLLPMDAHAFSRLGVGLDDLIEAYMQTVLAARAIDEMACELVLVQDIPVGSTLPPSPRLDIMADTTPADATSHALPPAITVRPAVTATLAAGAAPTTPVAVPTSVALRQGGGDGDMRFAGLGGRYGSIGSDLDFSGLLDRNPSMASLELRSMTGHHRVERPHTPEHSDALAPLPPSSPVSVSSVASQASRASSARLQHMTPTSRLRFRFGLFAELNPDEELLGEIIRH